MPDGDLTLHRIRPHVRARRREKILRAATDVFYEQGLRKATMDDIAARLHTSKIVLYRYFPTKDDLIAAILQRVMDRFNEMERQPWPNLKNALRRSLALAREDVPAYLLMSRSAAYDPVLSRYWAEHRALVYETTRRRLALLQHPICDDPAFLAVMSRGLVDFLFEALAYWVEQGESERDEAWLSWCAGAATAIAGWDRKLRVDMLPSVMAPGEMPPQPA
jgi:AcrR family transcriptional regulator